MKKLVLLLVFIVSLFSSGCFLNNSNVQKERNEDYSQAIGLNADLISKMNVGLRAPDGWEYTTDDKELINMTINFLQKHTYIKQNKPNSTGQPVAVNNPSYVMNFYIKDSQKTYNIGIDSYNGKSLGLEIYEKTTRLEEKYYSISSTPTEVNNLFDLLKGKGLKRIN